MIATYGEDHPFVRVNVFGEDAKKVRGEVAAEQARNAIKPKKKINGVKKGKSFEREWVNEIGHIFPEAKRHLEYQADEASHGVDLENTDIFKFQCKNYQGYAPIGKISEIRKLKNGEVPVLITKGNKLPAMAVIPAVHFIHLLEVYYGLEPQKTTNVKALERKETSKQLRLILSEDPKPSDVVLPIDDKNTERVSGPRSIPVEVPLTLSDLV